jgi:hypothetical protein
MLFKFFSKNRILCTVYQITVQFIVETRKYPQKNWKGQLSHGNISNYVLKGRQRATIPCEISKI